ncbi:hypothetical protein PIB19_05860 [Sphingomonas sp. 7/4-4]|jgi:hypothetical protein|uniref:hypothetical protein n=1 Tax=Sphingomonas sp. 7/4-4 TaxID=3018446 RepID=UPI0022F3A760|nr:hypothetical protein [Sphingomonas sp. 7/4-4]WBY08922.1 hypothetical protein PIB19_05860 [Sphingomonas sp. 7/4-4]
MSDVAILDDEDPREYRSPFDLALNPAALETFKWLVLGHVLYAIGLALVVYFHIDNGAVWITPLFGLPFVWRERQHRFAVKALVFFLGFTLMHYVALMTVSGMRGDEVGFLRGFVGGAVGGGGALLLCAIFGLVRKGSSLTFEAFGTVLLGAVGSFCLYLYLTTGATGDSSASDIIQPLKIYTPWQIAFAYVLARVLRPV